MKVVFILLYFGKLPNYFQLYLQSCKYNKDFDWLIITDDNTPFIYPDNVKVIFKTFKQIQCVIQSKFDFPISLERPYKLCDYRPAYGYIFQEYLTTYDFWGSVDPDCIWGDLKKFITEEILNDFDKIFKLGHLTLYRNTLKNNKMFMRPLNGKERYKEVFMTSESQQFDEAIENNSINDIYSYYHIPVYEDKNRADVFALYSVMRLVDYESPNREEIIESCIFRFFLNGDEVNCMAFHTLA